LRELDRQVGAREDVALEVDVGKIVIGEKDAGHRVEIRSGTTFDGSGLKSGRRRLSTAVPVRKVTGKSVRPYLRLASRA
jgi:hypothetical protein